MPDNMVEIINREIFELQRLKHNFCKRKNYKINQLRDQLKELLEVEDVDEELDIPDNVVDDVPAEVDAAPVEEVVEESFEIGNDPALEYDVMSNNMWANVGFSTLKPGDVIRVREGDKVIYFHGEKIITPVSYGYMNKDKIQVIRVKVIAT